MNRYYFFELRMAPDPNMRLQRTRPSRIPKPPGADNIKYGIWLIFRKQGNPPAGRTGGGIHQIILAVSLALRAAEEDRLEPEHPAAAAGPSCAATAR